MPFELSSEEDLGQLEQHAPAEPPARRSMTVADVPSLRSVQGRTIQWVCEGILPEAVVCALCSESGVGKTTLIHALCGAVDSGEPFAGRATSRRPILMLDRENPPSIVLERAERLGVFDSDNFKIWGGWCDDEPPALSSPVLIDWVTSCDPKPLLVVDSFIAFHRGDENSATEVRATIQHLRRLADLGATVVVLHHSGKADSSKDFRGSSDIKAAIDVGFHLSSLSGDAGKLGKLRLRPFKARIPVGELALAYVDGRFEIDGAGAMLTTTEIMIQILVDNPNHLATQFEADAFAKGVPRSRARDFLSSAIQAGTVQVKRGANNAKYHSWVGEKDDVL